MTSTRYWVLSAALLLSACSGTVPPWHQAPWPFKEFDKVSTGQSGCYHFHCPAFDLEIHADGRVRHSGPYFDATGGSHEARIDRAGLEQIASALRTARFDEMRDSYQSAADGCENVFSDMSDLHFSVRRGDRMKTVQFYAGCVGPRIPTDRINALMKAIDQVTGTGALLAQRKRKLPLGSRLPNGAPIPVDGS